MAAGTGGDVSEQWNARSYSKDKVRKLLGEPRKRITHAHRVVSEPTSGIGQKVYSDNEDGN